MVEAPCACARMKGSFGEHITTGTHDELGRDISRGPAAEGGEVGDGIHGVPPTTGSSEEGVRRTAGALGRTRGGRAEEW